jgi:hypothetical protein
MHDFMPWQPQCHVDPDDASCGGTPACSTLPTPHRSFWDELFDWNTKSSINYLAGTVAWLGGAMLWVGSLEWVRRRWFRVFYVSHILGAIVFFVFAHIHFPRSYSWMAPGATPERGRKLATQQAIGAIT